MIGIKENKIIRVPLMEALAMVRDIFNRSLLNYWNRKQPQTRAVADAISAMDFSKAMALRDPEFSECLEGFIATSELTGDKQVPKHQVYFNPRLSGASLLRYSILENARRVHAVKFLSFLYPSELLMSSLILQRGSPCRRHECSYESCRALLPPPRPQATCNSQRFPWSPG